MPVAVFAWSHNGYAWKMGAAGDVTRAKDDENRSSSSFLPVSLLPPNLRDPARELGSAVRPGNASTHTSKRCLLLVGEFLLFPCCSIRFGCVCFRCYLFQGLSKPVGPWIGPAVRP